MGKLVDSDVELRLDGTVIDDYKNFSFEINSEKIDTTNMSAQGWEKIKHSKNDLKVNVSGNFDKSSTTTFFDLLAYFMGKTVDAYSVFYKTAAVTQRESITGEFLVETWSMNSNDGEEVQWSCTLANSGEPTVVNKAA